MLPVVVARSSSDDSPERYAVQFLWTMSFFHIMGHDVVYGKA